MRKMHFFCIFLPKNLVISKKAVPLHPLSKTKHIDLTFIVQKVAEIAQLVEHDLAKVGVASSSLVFRSFFLLIMSVSPDGGIGRRVRFRCACREVCRFESCSGHPKRRW